VLSDVPLAVLCLPEANSGALQEVVGCLVALKETFSKQVPWSITIVWGGMSRGMPRC
jgi:hypothetical protein